MTEVWWGRWRGSPRTIDFYRRALEPSTFGLSMADEVDVTGDGQMVAFTGYAPEAFGERRKSRIWLWRVGWSRPKVLTREDSLQRSPKWTPAGTLLAYSTSIGGGSPCTVEVFDVAADAVKYRVDSGMSRVHRVEWFDDGRRLLLLGSVESDVRGGIDGVQVDACGEDPSWLPTVRETSSLDGPMRVLKCVDVWNGSVVWQSRADVHLWDFVKAGNDAIVVYSKGRSEGTWFSAALGRLGVGGRSIDTLYAGRAQIGALAASADGGRVAAVIGVASDRGMVAGDVHVFGRGSLDPIRIDLGGIDATWVEFEDDEYLLAGGVSGVETVYARVALGTGSVQELYRGNLSSTSNYPAASVDRGGRIFFFGDDWGKAPGLCRVADGHEQVLFDIPFPCAKWLNATCDELREVEWESPDGLTIGGLLGGRGELKGRQPTVVLAHGGPAYCWRPAWPGRRGPMRQLRLAACLVALGYRVLLPNPRGSSGRGQSFLQRQIGDYGGGECQDLLAGVEFLIGSGLAIPDRIALMGASHGGYLACWVPTQCDAFCASVALSPIADWYSQHFGGNLAEFDEYYLNESVGHALGPHFARNPVLVAHKSRTPTLIAAGGRDSATPAGQAVEYFHALARTGVTAQLVVYPKEGHGVESVEAEVDFAARAAHFLGRYTGVGS